MNYASRAFVWLLLFVPVALAPQMWLLPYSVPMGGAALWLTYCLVTNRTYELRVSAERIAWDASLSQRTPRVVLIRDILRLTVERKETDASSETHIVVYPKDGSEQLLPPTLLESRDAPAPLKPSDELPRACSYGV